MLPSLNMFRVLVAIVALSIICSSCSFQRTGLRRDVQFEFGAIVETRFHKSSYRMHNLVDLRITTSAGAVHEAGFLSFFDRTGGVDRWGHPISEVFEEQYGVLVQYFENGIIQFAPHRGIEAASIVEELSGAKRAETGLENQYYGLVIGPEKHTVSNLAVDGATTGFLDAFVSYGGIDSFGYPQSEARADSHPMARFSMGVVRDNVVRQYFQGAILEHHTHTTLDTTIRPIGTQLRERRYPNDEWVSVIAFRSASPVLPGSLYPQKLLQHFRFPVLFDDRNQVLVGRSTHPYAIAYHSQRHLLYRSNDGWYALYYDGKNGVVAYSLDGTSFGNHRIVTHITTGPGMSMYDIDERIYLLYSDIEKRNLYLRTANAVAGDLILDNPVRIADMGAPLMAYIANLAVDPDGRLWVLIRSYQDTPSGAANHLWLTSAIDKSLQSWSEPVRLTTDGDSRASTFGTSGSLDFVGDHLVVAYNLATEIRSLTGERTSLSELLRSRVGSFEGTHDYIVIASKNDVHLAYHAKHPGGQMMTYQRYSPDNGWSAPLNVGKTGTHATAMSVDTFGNVWLFYGDSREVRYRVWFSDKETFGPESCVVRIDKLVRAGSPWLASAQPTADRVGLLWTERVSDRWEIRFIQLSLEVEPGLSCDYTAA
jgi:hypothetical protein